MAIRLAVLGAGGRMGQAIAALAAGDQALELAALVEATGKTAGAERHGIPILADARAAFGKVQAAIDFTAPEAALNHAKLAAEAGVALVIGTTGIGEAGR